MVCKRHNNRIYRRKWWWWVVKSNGIFIISVPSMEHVHTSWYCFESSRSHRWFQSTALLLFSTYIPNHLFLCHPGRKRAILNIDLVFSNNLCRKQDDSSFESTTNFDESFFHHTQRSLLIVFIIKTHFDCHNLNIVYFVLKSVRKWESHSKMWIVHHGVYRINTKHVNAHRVEKNGKKQQIKHTP